LISFNVLIAQQAIEKAEERSARQNFLENFRETDFTMCVRGMSYGYTSVPVKPKLFRSGFITP
jgi:hypothetical protein